MATIVVDGLEELTLAFNQFSAGTSKRILRGSLRAAGRVMNRGLKAAAPKRTGRLSRTVRVIGSGSTTDTAAYIRIGSRGTRALFDREGGLKLDEVKHGGTQGHYYSRQSKRGGRRTVGRLRYWHFVISGTRPHRIGGIVVINGRVFQGIDHPGALPNPFVRSAFNANRQQAVEAFAAELRRGVEEWSVVLPRAA